jgi:uncharacterized membrane protein YhhN
VTAPAVPRPASSPLARAADAWRAAPAALRWLPPAAALSLALHLRAVYAGPSWQVFVFKPLTTTLVLLLALLAPGAVSARYRRALVAGLVFSLVGDVVLILPGDRFVAGLAAFLVAHAAYLVAFTDGVRVRLASWTTAAYVAVGGGILASLWGTLGPLRLPVAAYVGVILLMAAQAAGRAATLRTPGSRAAAGGAALFVVSDATLAIDRFGGEVPGEALLVMLTYVAAQLLIAASVADSATAEARAG